MNGAEDARAWDAYILLAFSGVSNSRYRLSTSDSFFSSSNCGGEGVCEYVVLWGRLD